MLKLTQVQKEGDDTGREQEHVIIVVMPCGETRTRSPS